MNGFRFKQILRYRRHREDILLSELNAAKATLAIEEAVCREKEEERQRINDCIGEKMKKGSDSRECLIYSFYVRGISEQIKNHHINIFANKNKVQEKQNELLSAMKKRKTLEKLEEKHVQNEKYSEKMAEIKKLDEFSTSRFIKNNGVNLNGIR
jgi:flagellar export protein FliJ